MALRAQSLSPGPTKIQNPLPMVPVPIRICIKTNVLKDDLHVITLFYPNLILKEILCRIQFLWIGKKILRSVRLHRTWHRRFNSKNNHMRGLSYAGRFSGDTQDVRTHSSGKSAVRCAYNGVRACHLFLL